MLSMISSESVRPIPNPREPKSRRIVACRPDVGVPAWFYTSRRFPPLRIPPTSPPDDSPDDSPLYEVRIIDNDYNTYQEVMDITMLALGIPLEEAFAVAWEVDHRGYCVVAHAPYEDAEGLADVIRGIGIEVQVNPIAGRSGNV